MKLPWRYILVSLAIGLFLGAAGGIFAARCLRPQWMRRNPEMMVRHFDRELHLTDLQRTQIRLILAANRDKMRTCRQDVRQAAHTEIRKLLTPEQQTKFDAWEQRRVAQHQKRGERAVE